MVNYEQLEGNKVKYSLSISQQTFAEAVEAAYKKNGHRYQIPGFRKGKAPRRMLEKQYGQGLFYEDAFDECYWLVYVEAVKESGFTPVSQPQLDVLSISEEEGCSFTAQIFVKPVVTVDESQYKGIEVERREYTVTDQQVLDVIEKDRERLSRYVSTNKPIQKGDRVVFDYSGSVHGVKFDGGTAENQTLDIGSERFIPGFEDKLVGFSSGQEGEIAVPFPDEYHAPELAGKDAVFAVKIIDVKCKELPEADDELAKDVSEFDTLEEYKVSIRSNLEAQAAEKAEGDMRAEIMDKLIANVEFDVPAPMVDTQTDRIVSDFAQRVEANGLKLDQYLSIMGMDEGKMREQIKPDAQKRVRGDLIIEAVMKREDITADDGDYEKEVERLAKSFDKTVEETLELLRDADKEYILEELALSKTMDFIFASAIRTDPKPEIPEEQHD